MMRPLSTIENIVSLTLSIHKKDAHLRVESFLIDYLKQQPNATDTEIDIPDTPPFAIDIEPFRTAWTKVTLEHKAFGRADRLNTSLFAIDLIKEIAHNYPTLAAYAQLHIEYTQPSRNIVLDSDNHDKNLIILRTEVQKHKLLISNQQTIYSLTKRHVQSRWIGRLLAVLPDGMQTADRVTSMRKSAQV